MTSPITLAAPPAAAPAGSAMQFGLFVPQVIPMVVVGVVWAAWRLEVDDEATSILGTLVASVALSVLLGYLGNGSWWQRWITAGVVQSILSIGLAFVAGTDPTGTVSLVVAGASVVIAVAWMLMFRAAQRRRAARAA